MTSKQRAYLKSLAVNLDTIFQVGKGGITDELCSQLLNALNARELIKIKTLENSPISAKDAGEMIAKSIGAEVVQVIGTKIVLFRVSDNEKNRKIELKKIK
ncbi:MAG: YhbY family RNA-binding protein [Clostridia bacterium]|nr:YhbY family RNA-binding protein [Clostridia bacterium]MBR2944148.1 YhbY family RNA-binding protein [Clostridia bacterium]